MQKSSIGKKKSAWIGAGRRRDQERKSSLLYADVKRRNRESESIPHEKQGIKLAPHDELAIHHSIKKNKKKNQKSSIKKKVSAWIWTGRRQDKEQKSSFLYAEVKRQNRESQSIPHEKQGIKLAPHDELAIRHSIKEIRKIPRNCI